MIDTDDCEPLTTTTRNNHDSHTGTLPLTPPLPFDDKTRERDSYEPREQVGMWDSAPAISFQ
jgi:hypothetical protein